MSDEPKIRRGDLRQALLDYAMQAAIDGEVETMSLRKAARDLGVSSGAVYRHFADKDALLIEIVLLGLIEMRDAYREIRPQHDPASDVAMVLERAHRLVSFYIRFAIERPALWRMMFGRVGMLCRQKVMEEMPEEIAYTALDAVRENYLDLYRLGAIDVEPSMSDLRFCWSAVHGAADLAQSGARLDSERVDLIIEETVIRNFRSIGFDASSI